MTIDELSPRIDALEARLATLAQQLNADELTHQRQRIADTISAAEQAQRKADDEARRAHDAKLACEEHAKFTTATRGNVEVELGAINTLRAKCDEAERAISAQRAAVDEAVKTISSTRDTLQKAEAWVTQNLSQLEGHAAAIVSSHESSEAHARECSAAANTAKVALEAAIRQREQMGQVFEATLKLKTDIKNHSAHAAEAEKAAETSKGNAAAAADKSEQLAAELQRRHEEVGQHRDDLAALRSTFHELTSKVEGLLPHAASAGLASAFREQKARFKKPQKWWLITFVATLVLLFGIAVPDFARELKTVSNTTAGWDPILKHIVRRLPLAIPLVWLAIYAGRNYTTAVRLEEDYAYKEAVSTAFEGYKREMASVPSTSGTAPLHTLCDNVLNAIAQRPGRIYDGEHQDVTPLTPALNAAGKLFGRRASPASFQASTESAEVKS